MWAYGVTLQGPSICLVNQTNITINGVPVTSSSNLSSVMSLYAQKCKGYEDEMLEYVSPSPSTAQPAANFYGVD